MIYLGADHAGFETKEQIKKILSDNSYQFVDLGTNSALQKVDYPDYAKLVANKMQNKSDQGILICGTGIGMSIAANRFSHIRAALAWNEEVAEASRGHNDSNVLCLSGRNVSKQDNVKIVKKWLETPFSNEDRHIRRVSKIS